MTIITFKVGRFEDGEWAVTDHYTTGDNIPNDILDALSASTLERNNAFLTSGASELDSGFTRALVAGDFLALNPTII